MDTNIDIHAVPMIVHRQTSDDFYRTPEFIGTFCGNIFGFPVLEGSEEIRLADGILKVDLKNQDPQLFKPDVLQLALAYDLPHAITMPELTLHAPHSWTSLTTSRYMVPRLLINMSEGSVSFVMSKASDFDNILKYFHRTC